MNALAVQASRRNLKQRRSTLRLWGCTPRPTIGRPFSTIAAQIVKYGRPFRKATVPSMGSTTQTNFVRKRVDRLPFPLTAIRTLAAHCTDARTETCRLRDRIPLPAGPCPCPICGRSHGRISAQSRPHPEPPARQERDRFQDPATVMPSTRHVGALKP